MATAATSWTLTLPWNTPPLNMNQRLHWRVKARLTSQIREAACLLAKHHRVDKDCAYVRITLIYHPPDRRRRDAINLSPVLKAVEDGLVDARVVADDTPAYLQPTVPLIGDRVKGGKLLVQVDRLA